MKYDDFSSSFKLSYPELTSIRERYFALLSFGSMSLRVGSLCHDLISVWFNCAGSRHNLTLPFGLGTSTKLLHHFDVSSTLRGAIMSCFCSFFKLLHKGFLVVCTPHSGGCLV